jgi:hypothetical protein
MTTVMVFSQTLYTDPAWKSIRERCERKHIPFVGFTSIIDRDDGIPVNILETWISDLRERHRKECEPSDSEEEEQAGGSQLASMMFGEHKEDEPEEDDEEKPRKSRKASRYQYPEYLLVFDDIASELKANILAQLVKTGRHYKMKIVISTQWYADIRPEIRKNINEFLLFHSIPDKQLQEIHKGSSSNLPLEVFSQLYHIATEEPHSFFFVGDGEDYRINFNRRFKLVDTA